MSQATPRTGPNDTPALKHPGRWLWLLLLIPVVIGFTRLRFDVEVFDLLPTSLPAVEGLKLYQEHFANSRELIITLQGSGAEATEETARAVAERLRGVKELVESVTWEPPWLEHPEQAAELIAYLWLNQPPEEMERLRTRLAPDHAVETLARTREELATSMSPQEIGRLSYDPFGVTRLPESIAGAAPKFGQGQELFGSADGTFRVVFLKARNELRTYRECARWLEAIRKIVADEIAKTPNRGAIKIQYTGRPAFVTEIASGMQQDMTKSIGGTALIIAILFWLAHRRIKPMLWLLTLLALILASTLGLGGLVFGTINVVSMGFAGILLGLAVDYAVVHYQEALAQPDLSIPQIRAAIAPSIFWAAVTTISAFLVLNFGGLPGLGQLGTLVGLGVGLAALIMIFEFLPPLFPNRRERGLTTIKVADRVVQGHLARNISSNALPFITTAVVAGLTTAMLLSGLPGIDTTAAALRPRHSEAYQAVEQIQNQLSQRGEPLWLILGGNSVSDVANLLDQAQATLNEAQSNNLVASFNLPTQIWPRPQNQESNRTTAQFLAGLGPALREAALTNGFAPTALVLTENVLKTWRNAARTKGVFWPTNPVSEWIFEKVAARTPTNYLTIGMLSPVRTGSNAVSTAWVASMESRLPNQGAWLSGWELLGNAIFGRVKANMWKVLVPMIVLVLLSLFLAFRRWLEILLSLAVLTLSGLCLLSIMKLVGWSWNLLNLMALPLMLGTGVDYGIFMQLALRRHDGDKNAAYQSVGRALLLCGGTAIAGFGSLGLSSNAGMASLGQVCAVGIGSNMLIAIFLLPSWWTFFRQRTDPAANKTQSLAPTGPSSLYSSNLWRAGLALVRVLPIDVAVAFARCGAVLYSWLAPHRRQVVSQNLAPALSDGSSPRETTRDLFSNFGRKLIHLWRYESGVPIGPLLSDATGWEHFQAAHAENRGVLLVTPHLGNWEFGAPLLTQRGVSLQVLTLAEPGREFTQLRQASRARWKVETLVVGEDPLAFVEIIKRLESGATVALLVDRPPKTSSVEVELFGRPFAASVAAAELARASGCALVPVYIPWERTGYSANMLPPIPYDRAALRDRQARQQLTQAIMTSFEPIIRKYITQWYHFVPVWSSVSKDDVRR
jgi:uncharacterized protein